MDPHPGQLMGAVGGGGGGGFGDSLDTKGVACDFCSLLFGSFSGSALRYGGFQSQVCFFEQVFYSVSI